MKSKLGILFLAVQAWAVGTAGAATLIDVTSTYPDGYKGRIETLEDAASGEIQKFVYTDSRGANLTYTVEEIRGGVVLLYAIGKDIIKLKAPGFDSKSGGPFKVQFLRRFFGSDVREVELELIKPSGQSPWVARTNDRQGRDVLDGLKATVGMSVGVPSGVDRIGLFLGKSQIRDYDPTQLPRVSRKRR